MRSTRSTRGSWRPRPMPAITARPLPPPHRLRLKTSIQLAQLVAPGLTQQIAALFVPGTQDNALHRAAVEGGRVDARAVGMAMDDTADTGAPQRADRRLVDVHDIGDGAGSVRLAAATDLTSQQLPGRQGQFEEAPLPGRLAHGGAQFLVG